MSVRGGIVDVFPPSFDNPLRIEWFDDEIDTIRAFNVSDQRSLKRQREVVLPPARELFASFEQLYQSGDRLVNKLNDQLRRVKDPKVKNKLHEQIGNDIEQFKQGQLFPGIHKYISLIYPACAHLTDYMPKDTVLLYDDPSRIQETAKQMDREEAEWQTERLQRGEALPGLEMSERYDDLMKRLSQQKVYLTMFVRQVPNTQPQNIVNFITRTMQQFHGQMHALKAEWDRWLKTKNRVVFLASNEERARRLKRVLGDYGMEVDWVDRHISQVPTHPSVLIGSVQNGFELPNVKLVVVTESEVFTQKQRRPRRVAKMSNAERIKSYQDLQPGDYVVHVNHGIGKYLGIETLNVGGMHKDYLNIHYAGNDKLYVPIEQIDLVQKYVGGKKKRLKCTV